MKDKKISFTHFHNQRLKEVTIGGVLVKPLYFRIIHNRKKTEIRTECFNYFIGLDSKEDDWIDIIIDIDKKIIEKSILISKKDESFDFEIFKINYRTYSKNKINGLKSTGALSLF